MLFMLTDVECGGGFYVRSLVDDLGTGKKLKLSLGNTDTILLRLRNFIIQGLRCACVPSAALSSCAHVRELTRTKQGQFTLQEHVLREERWTFQDISEVLQPCSKPAAVHKKSKRQDVASQLSSECPAKDHHHSKPDNVGEDHKHSSD